MTDRRIEIAENLAEIRATIPSGVHLIVVTKTFPLSDVQILHELGVAEFGENRDQEGKLKAPLVPGIWHFQGQLQSNKLKSICGWADVIQSIDSIRYVELVSQARERVETTKPLEIFIQVSLEASTEESRKEARKGAREVDRGGAEPSQLNQIADLIMTKSHLKLQGLMAVAPLNQPAERAFEGLAKIHQEFSANYPAPFLSAGMSGDYRTAIEYGATHVRIGSSILGSRPAHP